MTIITNVSTPATAEAAIRSLIVTALATAWTVPSSSDGTTYNSSGNQITTDSGVGSLDTAGAWVRLRQPGGGRELLFQRGSTSLLWRALYSVAGFSGGSPDALKVPTATDQQFLIGSGTDSSPGYATLFTTNGTWVWLAALDNAPPYSVWAAGLTIGSLTPVTAIALLGLEAGSYDTLETDPYVAYASSSNVFVQGHLYQAEGTVYSTFKSFYRYGMVGQGWTFAPFATPWIGQGNIGGEATLVSLGLSSDTSSQEYPYDILCGHRHGGYQSIKGRVKNAKWTSRSTASAPNGSRLADGSSAYWVRVGDLWLSWDSSVPSL